MGAATLFDHLRHREEAVLGVRRVGEDRVAAIAGGHFVVAQAKLVEEHLQVLRIVYLLCADEEAMIHRIKRRAIRENHYDDANEDVIRRRFEVYRRETQPVLDCYPNEIVSTIDAIGSPAEVLRNILECLIPIQNEHFRSGWE